jgi:hypothetical protein
MPVGGFLKAAEMEKIPAETWGAGLRKVGKITINRY